MNEQAVRKCLCCGNTKLNKMDNKCPVCGFVLPGLAGNVSEIPTEVVRGAAQYREQILKNIGIELKTFYYEKRDGMLEVKEEKQYTVAPSAAQLQTGVISWCSQEFAGIEGGVPVTLELLVNNLKEDGSREKTECRASIQTPELSGLWRLGVEMTEGFRVRFYLGNEDKHTRSDEIELIPTNDGQ